MTNKELNQEQVCEFDCNTCIDDSSLKGWSDEQINRLMFDIFNVK